MEIEDDDANRPETMSVEEWERRMRAPFAEYDTDEQAQDIIQRFIDSGQPFVLYLRNFELEAYDLLKPSTADDPQGQRWGLEGGPSTLEGKLAHSLGERVVVIAIANPSRTILSMNLFPRLRLPADGWLGVVEWLMRAASFIVVEILSLAPGISMELEAIERSARRDDTVVVLTQDDGNYLGRLLLETMGAQLPKYPKPDRQSQLLADFPRVVREDEIPFEDLSASPALADLLDTYHRRARGEADADTRHRQAYLAAIWGLLQIDQGDTKVGLRTLALAAAQFNRLNDRASVAKVLKDIGETYLEIGQYDDAVQAFRDAGTISSIVGNDHDFRYAACKIAIAHYLNGDMNTAVAYLVGARDQSQAAGDHEMLVYSLELLHDIYRKAGERRSMKRIEKSAKTAQRGDRR